MPASTILPGIPDTLLLRLRADSEAGKTLHTVACGVGVQSTTIALLTAQGRLHRPDIAVFADTGWEMPATYSHLDRVRELWDRAGVPFVTVSGGNIRTEALRTDGGHYATMPLHIRRTNGSLGMLRRGCTDEYKKRPQSRLIRVALGARISDDGRIGPVPRGRHVIQTIGFSADEHDRVDDSPFPNKYTEYDYPLLSKLTRKSCQQVLEDNDLGDTPSSSCVGCPFHGNERWRDMKENQPDAWADAVEVDRLLRNGHPSAGTPLDGQAFLHRSRVPLDQAPIKRVTRKEWRDRQGEVDVLGGIDKLEAYEEDPPGCSPFGCRTPAIPPEYAVEVQESTPRDN